MSTAQNPWPSMGQLFVESGRVTSAQLESALAQQREQGGPLGEILVERGHISRFDLAGALSTQWSWKGEVPESLELPTPPMPLQETSEPEPVAAAPEYVPLPAPPPAVAEPELEAAPPEAPATPVPGLEDRDRLLVELQTRLRGAHEHLAAGESRLGSLEAILAQLSQAYVALNARLDAQAREIEDLRREAAENAAKIANAAKALLA